MSINRRNFIVTGAAAAGFLLANPVPGLARTLGPERAATARRRSKLARGLTLVHADLHNHSLLSDGDGDPGAAFASMRANGLDVAALTDHSVLGGLLGGVVGACSAPECTSVRGIDDGAWDMIGRLADAAEEPGGFTALRGFEWSSPTLGHMNVWMTQEWTDPERTGGLVGIESLPGFLHEVPALGPALSGPLTSVVGALPTTGAAMQPFYEWLRRDPGETLGGGADGLAGFNHPGREPGRFGFFSYDAAIAERVVSIEMFNRREDYLFEGTDAGSPSPLVQCLDAGWRTGIVGVTDEHGTDWGAPEGKGRTGLWVSELSRAGVRAAMLSRRVFATRERGLRLDAIAWSGNRSPRDAVAMGSTIPHRSGPVTFALDVAGGEEWTGRDLLVQVLRPGGDMPTIAHTVPFRPAGEDDDALRFTVELSADDGTWVVLRVTEPGAAADGRATGEWAAAGRAVAYASPFWLDPAG